MNALLLVSVIIGGVCVLALFVTGALLSRDVFAPSALPVLHAVATELLVLCGSVTAYLIIRALHNG